MAVSFDIDAVGEKTPLDAVNAHGNGIGGAPTSGWVLTGQGPDTASAVSGHYSAHMMKMRNGTWLVDTGSSCLRAEAPAEPVVR